jgi:hypothetical protein
MKTLFKILMVLAVLLVVFLVVGMMLPEKLQVERSIVIRADANKVYPYVSNFRQFNQWSPWAKIDPNIEFTYEGPEKGEGAIMHWRSEHAEVGQGSQKILQANPGHDVRIVLAFGGMGKAYSNFQLQPEQGSTMVSWAFDMHFGYNIPGRIMGLFIGDQIGDYYDKGLSSLKQLVEQEQP